MDIGKIVSDVELIPVDELQTEDAPAEPAAAEARPQSVPAR